MPENIEDLTGTVAASRAWFPGYGPYQREHVTMFAWFWVVVFDALSTSVPVRLTTQGSRG